MTLHSLSIQLIWEIGIAVFGAAFGALFSFLLPVVLSNAHHRKRPELLGVWKSTYRPDFRDSRSSISEDVEIDLHFGKLRMRNRRNPSEDPYEVHAELVQRMYIIGRWLSLKPGANASGVVILTISPLGDLMYGYFTGLGNTGERTYCGWVMVRKQEDLNTALKLLKSATLNLARPETSRWTNVDSVLTR